MSITYSENTILTNILWHIIYTTLCTALHTTHTLYIHTHTTTYTHTHTLDLRGSVSAHHRTLVWRNQLNENRPNSLRYTVYISSIC